MAVRQINTADFDYAMMLETINKSYKGKNDITISEYDTDAAPDVKVGSVWEDNGAIFILESADMTPTGYGGIANSTTFYLYYDESGEVFIYSSTVPSWNDALQGWYNANDRAFFSMFKDSGGTLYLSKSLLLSQNNLKTPGYIDFVSKRITSANYIELTGATENTVYDIINPFIPNIGDSMLINGAIEFNQTTVYIVSRATKPNASSININAMSPTGGLAGLNIADGDATVHNFTLSW